MMMMMWYSVTDNLINTCTPTTTRWVETGATAARALLP